MRKILILGSLIIGLSAKVINVYPNSENVCKNAKAGDTIYFNDGIYKNEMVIRCKGNKNSYITITGAKNAKIKNTLKINGNYLIIKNLNLKGDNNLITYDEAIKHWWEKNKKYNKKGMLIRGHHLIIKDNTIGYFPGAGIKITGKSDYITINHNIIYNNAWWSPSGTDGLVVKNINQIDNKQDAKIKIINNLFFGNESRIFSRVFTKGFAKLTIDEGASFLIQQQNDKNNKKHKKGKYDGKFLVKNNLILYNGKGSSLNKVNNVYLIQNYFYANGTTAKSPKAGGIRGKNVNNSFFENNEVDSGNKYAISIIGKNNKFLNNKIFTTNKHQPIFDGIIRVNHLFNDPKNLDFNKNANNLLDSFKLMLKNNSIKIKNPNYKVDYKKQISDILKYLPRKSDTKIIKKKHKIIIKNPNVKAVKKKFVLILK